MARTFVLIPSVRDIRNLDKALKLERGEILLSTVSHIGNLAELTTLCHKNGKEVVVNHELIGGLGTDTIAFEMLKKAYKVDAVIGSNVYQVSRAKAVGLKTIWRIALLDSLSLEMAFRSIEVTKPDAIELRPAICAYEFLDAFRKVFSGKIFASGFVSRADFAQRLYQRGFDGIMTSSQTMWDWNAAD
jgi:hypothetical protein